jgi:hypothetical protein
MGALMRRGVNAAWPMAEAEEGLSAAPGRRGSMWLLEGDLSVADDGQRFGGATRLVSRDWRPLVLGRSSIRKLFGCGGVVE